MSGTIGVGTYVVGMAGLVAGASAVGAGAVAVRAVVVPAWTGARARLAEAVVFLATVLAVAQVLGAVQLLRAPVVLVAELAAGLGLVAAARWWTAAHATTTPTPPEASEGPGAATPDGLGPQRRVEWGLAAVGLAIVGTQWLAHTVDALRRGMPHPDTHWYHGPYVARFVTTGGFGRLDALGYDAARWFPFDAHLLHVLVVLPHRRDWLSPTLNLAWAVLALLALWCIGERRGAGPTALALGAVGLGLPIMAATQPGQMSTDIACIALLLTAVALLLEGDLAPGPVALAGAAAGLGLSTKATVAVPLAVLCVAVLVVLLVGRRPGAAAWWTGAAVVTGSPWFVRNWVLGGNPLPWFPVPPLFDQVTPVAESHSLATAGVFGRAEWDAVYRPGLHQAFGAAWPVVSLLLLVGAAAVVRGRGPVERIAGLVVVAGVAGWWVSPATADVGFVFNLRYLGPSLLLGAGLAPLVLPARPRVRLALGAAAVGLVVVGATADHHERTPAWPASTSVAVALALVAVAGAVAVWRFRPPLQPLVAALVVVAVVAGLPVQREVDERRYVTAGLGPSDVVSRTLRDVTDTRVVVYGTAETYPLFGRDLSNDVELGTPPPHGSTCADWRRHLGGRFDVVAVSVFAMFPLPRPADEDLVGDPAVTVLARDGESAVYRIDGALDPTTCPV